jgi:hypothetical protein
VESTHHADVRSGRRILALGQQDRVGVRVVQPLADLPPQCGRRTEIGVVLNQRIRHVHPKAGHAAGQPEGDDLAQGLPVALRPARIDGLAPRLVRIHARVAEVQRQPLVKEVAPVETAPRAR